MNSRASHLGNGHPQEFLARLDVIDRVFQRFDSHTLPFPPLRSFLFAGGGGQQRRSPNPLLQETPARRAVTSDDTHIPVYAGAFPA
jgi:hypothetical protein